MLVIDPLLCIDCGICEPACPADAIRSGAERGLESWVEVNARYADLWPEITVRREPAADARQWDGRPDKLALFSALSGAGDAGQAG